MVINGLPSGSAPCGRRNPTHMALAQARSGCALNRPGFGGPSACRFKGGYAMRTFDLSPLYRSTVGFDRLFSMLDQPTGCERGGSPYPPFNIVRTDKNAYRVTIGVAGLSYSELSIEAKENTLTVK